MAESISRLCCRLTSDQIGNSRSEVRWLRLRLVSTGGIHETAQGSGRYTYSDIIDSTSSDMELTGGPLDGESISYEDDALTGRQQFRISETQTFGLAVGASSSLTYVCAHLQEPRPFKQYGYAAS